MWLSYSSCVIKFFSDWYRRYFSDPQAVLLAVLLVLGFAIVIVMGGMLAPALAAIVIAYLLEGPVDKLEVHTPRIVAVTVVFCVFLTIFVFVLIGLMPLVSRQLIEFGQDLPRMIKGTQDLLTRLHDDFPQIITPEAISAVTAEFSSGITKFSSSVLSISLASIPAIITVLVYTILGPLLVFFFLKDRDAILAYMTTFLPRDRDLLNKVWHEMDDQIGNYVRGKAYEILIVGGVTYVTFKFLGVAYAPFVGGAGRTVGHRAVYSAPPSSRFRSHLPATCNWAGERTSPGSWWPMRLSRRWTAISWYGCSSPARSTCTRSPLLSRSLCLAVYGVSGVCSLPFRWRHWSKRYSTFGRANRTCRVSSGICRMIWKRRSPPLPAL